MIASEEFFFCSELQGSFGGGLHWAPEDESAVSLREGQPWVSVQTGEGGAWFTPLPRFQADQRTDLLIVCTKPLLFPDPRPWQCHSLGPPWMPLQTQVCGDWQPVSHLPCPFLQAQGQALVMLWFGFCFEFCVLELLLFCKTGG